MARWGSRVALALTLVSLGCLAFGAIAPAKNSNPPRVLKLPTANFVKGQGIGFAITIFNATTVTVTYGDRHHRAHQITIVGGSKRVAKQFWQADFSGQRKKCYDIRVAARNSNGTTTRKLEACRLGVQTGVRR